MKAIYEKFTDEEFRLLQNTKEEFGINTKVNNWHDFLLIKCLGKNRFMKLLKQDGTKRNNKQNRKAK